MGEGGARSAPGEGSAWLIGKMGEDIFQNGKRSLKHVIVPVSQHAKAFCCQECVAPLIAARFEMLAAVYLDNRFPVKADKVQNEILKRQLSANLEARKPTMT